MQLDVGKLFFQRRPFALRFLHTVFAEHALAGLDHRADSIGVECLGHSNERGASGGSLGLTLSGGDFVTDSVQIVDSVGHAVGPKVDGFGKAW